MKYFGIYYWQLRVTRLVPSADDKSRVTISAYSYVYVCRMEILEIGEKKKRISSLSVTINSVEKTRKCCRSSVGGNCKINIRKWNFI
jgi:hypothetical protein